MLNDGFHKIFSTAWDGLQYTGSLQWRIMPLW